MSFTLRQDWKDKFDIIVFMSDDGRYKAVKSFTPKRGTYFAVSVWENDQWTWVIDLPSLPKVELYVDLVEGAA